MAGTEELAERYLGYVDTIISRIPYKRVQVWKEFFLDPTATVRKDQMSIGQRMKDVLVSALIGGAIGFLIFLPQFLITAAIDLEGGILLLGFLASIAVMGILLSPLFAFIYSLLQLLVARLLGGTGDMEANFNASALPDLGVMAITLPLMLVSIPVTWFSMIPLVGLCAIIVQFPLGVINLIVWLYGLYLCYLAMKEVHKLSSLRTAAVVLVPPLVLTGIVVAVIVAIYAFLIAASVGIANAPIL